MIPGRLQRILREESWRQSSEWEQKKDVSIVEEDSNLGVSYGEIGTVGAMSKEQKLSGFVKLDGSQDS